MNEHESAPIEVEGFSSVEPIGRGGLGHVYRAKRDSTGAIVALKILHDVSDESAVWKRTRRELAALVALAGHAHVVQVHDTLEVDGAPVIVMEYAANGSVSDLLNSRGASISAPECLLVARHTTLALEAAHHRGIVHRDIKPQNLLIDNYGQIKLCDFGIATLARSSDFQDRTSAVSMRYASPEDLELDQPIGTSSDIYSLGATLLHLAHGAPPTLRDRLQQWEPQRRASGALAALDSVLETCLRPDPSERPTAAELNERLEQLDSWRLRAISSSPDHPPIDQPSIGEAETDAPVSTTADPGSRNDESPADEATPGDDGVLIRLGDDPLVAPPDITIARPRGPRSLPVTDDVESDSTDSRRLIALACLACVVVASVLWFTRPWSTADEILANEPAASPESASEGSTNPAASTTTHPADTQPLPAPVTPASVTPANSVILPDGAVGDCVNQVEGAVGVLIDCGEPHDVQRYGRGLISAAERSAAHAEIEQQCISAFLAFVFGDAEPVGLTTELDSFYTLPTAEAWADGDRGYDCWLHAEGARLVGDARATGW